MYDFMVDPDRNLQARLCVYLLNKIICKHCLLGANKPFNETHLSHSAHDFKYNDLFQRVKVQNTRYLQVKTN